VKNAFSDKKSNKWSKQFDKKAHRRRTWTVHSYSPGGAGEHPHALIPWAHPSPQSKRHLERFSRFAGLTTATDWQSRQTDWQTDRPR